MPKITRFPDWPNRLHSFLLNRDSMPFKWGVNDCALFSVDAIKAITGTDIAAEYRDIYKTHRGSLKAIHRIAGCHTVEDAAVHAARQHGIPEINPRLARRGDWLLVPNDGNKILGIAHLNGKHAVTVSDAGLIFLDMCSALRAWKV